VKKTFLIAGSVVLLTILLCLGVFSIVVDADDIQNELD